MSSKPFVAEEKLSQQYLLNIVLPKIQNNCEDWNVLELDCMGSFFLFFTQILNIPTNIQHLNCLSLI